MRNVFKFLIISLLIQPVAALDDYDLRYFGSDAKIEIGRTEVIVKMVFHPDDETLNDEWMKYNEQDKFNENFLGIRGFTLVNSEDPVCYIHMEKAEIWDDRENMTILGHEMYHCLLAHHRENDQSSAED